jgi:hypothetical protein
MAGYEPQRPRASAAPDLDALIGPSSDTRGAERPVSSLPEAVELDSTIPADPAPPAARQVLPRAAQPLDRRIPPLAVVCAGAAMVAAFVVFRCRRS